MFIANSCLDTSSNSNKSDNLNSNFDLIRINNEYSMELPTFMEASNDLNDDVSLQYQNIFKEVYKIMEWTDKRRNEKNKTLFQKIIKSFKAPNRSKGIIKEAS